MVPDFRLLTTIGEWVAVGWLEGEGGERVFFSSSHSKTSCSRGVGKSWRSFFPFAFSLSQFSPFLHQLSLRISLLRRRPLFCSPTSPLPHRNANVEKTQTKTKNTPKKQTLSRPKKKKKTNQKNKPPPPQKKKKNRAPAPHDRCGAVGVGDLVKRPRRVCETRRPRLVAGRGLGRRRDDLPEPARDVPQERAGARGEAVPGKQGGPGQRRGESSKIFFGFFLSFVHLLFFFQEETRNDEIKISPSLLLSLPLSTSNSPLLSSLTRTINKTNQ